MGLIHIDLFTTLDGVEQAPGGPDEDADDCFAFGGWQAPLVDDIVGAVRGLRDRHANIHVIGSLDFVQTLFAERLVDRLTLWVYPILLGHSRRRL